MKVLKLMTLLLVVFSLFTACLASPSKTGLQSDNSSQNEWQTFTSARYQFTLRYPTTWQVIELPIPEFPTVTDQVWLISEALPQPQTGSRADIVFIFTEQDPSSDWEPQYFDDYQSDIFQLGDIQARRISGVNKESGFSEVIVLARIGDYYLQALPNNGEATLAYFDQVISSIQFSQVNSGTPPTLTKNNPDSLEEKTIDFEGIRLTYPTSLAGGATAQEIAGFVDPSGFLYNNLPDHIRFDFTDPFTNQAPFTQFQPSLVPWLAHQNLKNPEIVPQIFFFPTAEYTEISPLAGERIEKLKILLVENALTDEGELPVLPTFNSAQDLHAQAYPLEFHRGNGVRFITRYSQGIDPVVNPSVFYTFQGLTEDGSIYVAAFFPLYISVLPNQTEIEDWDAFNLGYQDYMADVMSKLDGLNSNDYEPHLDILDDLMRSIIIKDETTSTSVDIS